MGEDHCSQMCDEWERARFGLLLDRTSACDAEDGCERVGEVVGMRSVVGAGVDGVERELVGNDAVGARVVGEAGTEGVADEDARADAGAGKGGEPTPTAEDFVDADDHDREKAKQKYNIPVPAADCAEAGACMGSTSAVKIAGDELEVMVEDGTDDAKGASASLAVEGCDARIQIHS